MHDEKLYILYFSSPDCNVCDVIFPKLMNLGNNYKIKVLKINVKEQMQIAGQFLVFTVPTILIINEGREILRESRFINLENIERVLSILKEQILG